MNNNDNDKQPVCDVEGVARGNSGGEGAEPVEAENLPPMFPARAWAMVRDGEAFSVDLAQSVGSEEELWTTLKRLGFFATVSKAKSYWQGQGYRAVEVQIVPADWEVFPPYQVGSPKTRGCLR